MMESKQLWKNRESHSEVCMCTVSTQQWPSTQVTLFERTRQSAWLDTVTTLVDKKRVNSCVVKHLSFGGNSATTKTAKKTHLSWVSINHFIARTKHAAIAALMSAGILVEERWWNETEFSIHRRQSGNIKKIKSMVWNATLKELFVQMDSDLGCEVTNDMRTIKKYQLENCSIFEPPVFHLSKYVRDEWTVWHTVIVAESWSHRVSNSMFYTPWRWSTYAWRSKRD